MAEETAGTSTEEAAATETAATETAPVTTETTTASVVPEKYELTLPKDSTLDAAVLEKSAAFARERGFSNEAAQNYVNHLNEVAEAHAAARLVAHAPGSEAWTKSITEHNAKLLTASIDAWKAETAADIALGKTPEERVASLQKAAAVLDRFEAANPDMGKAIKTALTTSGLAEHRAVAHLLNWLGNAASETPLVVPSGGGVMSQSETLAILYPSMHPKA